MSLIKNILIEKDQTIYHLENTSFEKHRNISHLKTHNVKNIKAPPIKITSLENTPNHLSLKSTPFEILQNSSH